MTAAAAVLTLVDVELTHRQRELADAALRIIVREGMGAVSFRTVAAESGWSLGAVQKAFPSKDLLYAGMFQRLREAASPVPLGEPGRPTLQEWLVHLMLAILPLDDERRALQLQGMAFAERAAYDHSIGQAIAVSDTEIRGLLAALVRRAQAEGEVGQGRDPDQVAWAFLAQAQGAASQLLYDPVPESEMRRRAEQFIAALLDSDAPEGCRS